MKKRETTKTSSVKKSLLKMLAGACVGAILGGFLGFAHFTLPAESSATISTQLRSSLHPLIFPGLVIITLISVISQEIYFARLKKICFSLRDADDEKFDLLDYEEEKNGAILQTINTLSQVFCIVLLSFGYSFDYLSQSIVALGSCIAFLICFFYDGFIQTRYIKLLQNVHPEKQGDASSFNFQKQWLASCDEAEKEVIYQSAYEAFSLTNKLIPFLLLLTMLGHLFLQTGIMAIIVVGIIYLTQSLIYYRSCVRLKKMKVSR